MNHAKVEKIIKWLGESVTDFDGGKISLEDYLAICAIELRMVKAMEPIYDKYHKKKEKPKQTADLLADCMGTEFAANALRGFVNFAANIEGDDEDE